MFGVLKRNRDDIGAHVLGVVVRLGLGVFLVVQSSVSKSPLVIEILGWLSIVAAMGPALIGRRNFHRLIAWSLLWVKPMGRIAGALAVVFGAFLDLCFRRVTMCRARRRAIELR